MGAHHGRVEHLHEMGAFTHLGERLEKGFEHTGLAQPPETLPDTVPMAKITWQRTPSDVVDRF
jgi:hypothetical protein